MDAVGLALLFPLLGFLYCALIGRRAARSSGVVATLAIGAAFVVALVVFAALNAQPPDGRAREYLLWDWIPLGQVRVPFGLLVDPLSTVMLLIVTGVGFLIHLYAIGYMAGDPGYRRFFAYMNLFVLAMLVLVLANNFLLLMVGWGGVGLTSYLLIAFWFERPDAAASGVKAFVTNAVGDVGLLIACFLLFRTYGRLDYTGVFSAASASHDEALLTIVTLLLLVAAAAKSGQVPLHVWLPDAMTGPTPVSALIHAATMVTAGVYLIARAHPLYLHAPTTMTIVAVVGIATALMGATIALVQDNIKRVLAYSTVSQLGLMFVAVGVGAFTAGIFHLFTHAFFKALLFLAAGAAIHALHGEEDMRLMGGLRRHLPLVFLTFVVGAAALSGVPLLAGFFSKDEIVSAAFASPIAGGALGALALVVTFLTAFYMTRATAMTFYGPTHAHVHADHLHRPGWVLTLPLVLLAALSIVAGYVQFPSFGFSGLLATTFTGHGEAHHTVNYGVMALSGAVALTGITAGALFYSGQRRLPTAFSRLAGGLPYGLLRRRYFFDELYAFLFVLPGGATAWLLDLLDRYVIDGVVNLVARVVRLIGQGAGALQTGYVRNYALVMLVGAIVIVGYLMRMGV